MRQQIVRACLIGNVVVEWERLDEQLSTLLGTAKRCRDSGTVLDPASEERVLGPLTGHLSLLIDAARVVAAEDDEDEEAER